MSHLKAFYEIVTIHNKLVCDNLENTFFVIVDNKAL